MVVKGLEVVHGVKSNLRSFSSFISKFIGLSEYHKNEDVCYWRGNI